MHFYLGIIPIEFSAAYFWADIHRIVLQIAEACLDVILPITEPWLYNQEQFLSALTLLALIVLKCYLRIHFNGS